MIHFSSIRFRIAAWYFLTAAPIVVGLAIGSWFAMRASMYYSLDAELFRETTQVDKFVESHGDSAIAQLQQEASSSLAIPISGELFQVYGENRNLLFETPALVQHHIPLKSGKTPNGQPMILWDSAPRGNRVRVGTRPVQVFGRNFTIQAAEPLRELDQSLAIFAEALYVAVPVLLLMLTWAGFWLSGRAMSPVERIINEARAIGPEDLTARLSVPKPQDELRTLSETLNAMLERIEAAVKRVTQFTADASHELRTPLTLIQSITEFLLHRERSRQESVEAFQDILEEVKQTSNLVDRLLTLARTDSGHSQMQAVPLDLTLLLGEVAEKASPLAQNRKINFTCHLDGQPNPVMGDEVSLRELFLILLDNAIKYTPNGGAVELSLFRDGNSASIEVRDTGIGMSDEDLPHIYDRFWRADKARSREIGGVGLGLSIAKWIVEQSRGTICVVSELGHGSSFTVQLPLIDRNNWIDQETESEDSMRLAGTPKT